MMMKALICVQLVSVSAQIVKDSLMIVSPLCDMNDRLDRGCARQETSVQNLPQCVMRCNADDTCVGMSMDINNDCIFHRNCPDMFHPCLNPDPNHKYFNKNCYNNGLWQRTENRCQCPTSMIGDRCDRYPTDCVDFISHGLGTSGVHELFLVPPGKGSSMFNVMCVVTDAAFQFYSFFKNGGRQSFNRTWQEYRDGFKIDDDHYWVGLESLHRLTNVYPQNRLRIGVELGEIGHSLKGYINFRLSDEASGYKISFDKVGYGDDRGQFGYKKPLQKNVVRNCFSGDIESIRFSTWDRDSDGDQSRNCASQVGSGWWFSGCDSKCNIFGFYPIVPAVYPKKKRLRINGFKSSAYQNQLVVDNWGSVQIRLYNVH